MSVDTTTLQQVIRHTWPPEDVTPCGPFDIAKSAGGGSRVRAARLTQPQPSDHPVTATDVAAASRAMAGLGQPDLFAVFSGQDNLDNLLETLGFTAKDHTVMLVTDAQSLAADILPVTTFDTWPPLAIQAEIWAEGGIGSDRLAIMDRVEGPKTTIFGRINDRPAATAFVAISGKVAMLHALEVAEPARRKGLARHMMHRAANWALEQGAETLSVLVTRENLPARGLYASLSFQPVGHYHYRIKTAG